MKLSRRIFLSLATSAAALPAASRLALAQAYPVRPVRLLVGFSAGSASDIVARLAAQRLSEQLGQPIVVENRPGAATNLAAEAVVRATADGYTLLLATSTNAVNATLYKTLSFNFSADIVPVACIDLVPYVLEVTPSLPAKTLPEFIAYAKANPGKINMASNGIGSGPHVAGVFFAPERTATGIRLLIAARGGSRLHRELAADPRVAFMCSPGNASRWIQGGGIASVVEDPGVRMEVVRRLIDHAAGAQTYVEGPEVLPVTIAVSWLKVVEARDGAHLLLSFDP